MASLLILTSTSCLTPSSSNTARPSESIFWTVPSSVSGGTVDRCRCSSACEWPRPTAVAADPARLDAVVTAPLARLEAVFYRSAGAKRGARNRWGLTRTFCIAMLMSGDVGKQQLCSPMGS